MRIFCYKRLALSAALVMRFVRLGRIVIITLNFAINSNRASAGDDATYAGYLRWHQRIDFLDHSGHATKYGFSTHYAPVDYNHADAATHIISTTDTTG